MTETAQSTAVAIPQGSALVDVFKTDGGTDPIIARIRQEVQSHKPDLTTAKGRKEIASLAYKVSQSKTALDDAGKKLAEDAKREIAVIDSARKKIRDQLDVIRDEARKPLTEWEAKEAARVQAAKDTLDAVRFHGLSGDEGSTEIANTATNIKAIIAKPEYDEYLPQIETARENTLAALRTMYAAAKKREDQEAELEQLRREKAEREAKEQAEREAKEAAEREAERIAEEKRQAEIAAQQEAERAARIEREKNEAAEKAAEAERKASADRETALKLEIEQAAQKERDRIAAEKKAEDDARAKREADQAHRKRIADAIYAALSPYQDCDDVIGAITDALMSNEIPHTKVTL